MMDDIIHWQSFIIKVFLLQNIIFQCSSQFWSTSIHNSCSIKHPFFFCNIIISNLTGIFVNTLKQFSVNWNILCWRKWKCCFGKNLYNTWWHLISLFCTIFVRQIHWSFFIIVFNQTLCFFNRYNTFNIFNGCINQIFRRF